MCARLGNDLVSHLALAPQGAILFTKIGYMLCLFLSNHCSHWKPWQMPSKTGGVHVAAPFPPQPPPPQPLPGSARAPSSRVRAPLSFCTRVCIYTPGVHSRASSFPGAPEASAGPPASAEPGRPPPQNYCCGSPSNPLCPGDLAGAAQPRGQGPEPRGRQGASGPHAEPDSHPPNPGQGWVHRAPAGSQEQGSPPSE